MLKNKRGQIRKFSLCNFSKKNRRGALEISFGWLFAIIAGIVILFFAFYLGSKIINSGQETVSAETGKEIGILLNPLETSFESAQTTSISIPVETKIHNGCKLEGDFGKQTIQLDQLSFNKWTETDIDVIFNNKYIFSNSEVQGKKFYIFSKPFYFPFKVADLIFMTSSMNRYCFVDAPSDIKEEISNLNQANLITEIKNCSAGDTRVCFSGTKCDINVDYNNGYVTKNNTRTYFGGIEGDYKTLMYAAIFSDKDVYECQLKRLMLRVKELATLYKDKELFTRRVGCDDNLGGDLNALTALSEALNKSEELGSITLSAENVNEKNSARMCALW